MSTEPSLPASDLPGPLLDRMAAFHAHVVRTRERLVDGSCAQALRTPEQPAPPPEALAQRVSALLAALLQEQRRQQQNQSPEALWPRNEQALYVMSSLTDELLIFNTDWSGQDAWLRTLLEQRLFGSRSAGQTLPLRAQALTASAAPSALERELAACYLMALQLGFKGMHRGRLGATELRQLRQRLGHCIGVLPASATPRPVCANAYAHTVVRPQDERIAPMTPWLRGLKLGLLAWLLLSTAAWWWLVQPLLQP